MKDHNKLSIFPDLVSIFVLICLLFGRQDGAVFFWYLFQSNVALFC